MTHGGQISRFLDGTPHAVVGASLNRAKYGNKVLRAYLQASRAVIPIHPTATEIEGIKAYPDLMSMHAAVHGISIVTPPETSLTIVRQAARCGIKHLWLQPGAENDAALDVAKNLGLSVISSGPCILVTLQYHDE